MCVFHLCYEVNICLLCVRIHKNQSFWKRLSIIVNKEILGENREHTIV